MVPQTLPLRAARRWRRQARFPGTSSSAATLAVVIGNNTYRDGGYAPLKSAASDATAVANVLRGRLATIPPCC